MSLRNQPAPEDQRNVIIATALVAIISFVWIFMMGPEAPPPSEQQAATAPDTAAVAEAPAADTAAADTATGGAPRATAAPSSASDEAAVQAPRRAVDPTLAGADEGDVRSFVVEHDLYTATFSTKGATLTRFQLKEYDNFDQESPVHIIDPARTKGALALAFTTPSSRLVDTRAFVYDVRLGGESAPVGDTLRVTGETALVFETAVGEGQLRQVFTFEPDAYDLGLRVETQNPGAFMTADGYEVIWDGGIPYSEGGTDDEKMQTGAFAYSGGEVESLTLAGDDEHEEKRLNGDVSWTAVKNKYFTATVMPDAIDATRGAELIGDLVPGTDGAIDGKSLTARLLMTAPTDRPGGDQFHLYVGPLYYYNLAKYDRDLYDMVDYGWDAFEWMTRPIATFIFIPILTFLGGALPSYGLAVILLGVIVKTVVYPLTKSSYRSMAQMRELQPKMQEIKEKYGDDQQKQSEEMMKLYREAGANPLGGCLPMLLQYPILIALYMFIPQSIQLRQESFLWAMDLSAPDKIIQLPFTIPIYGDYVAGFTLLMGLAMLVQMRIQAPPNAGGQQQMLMYLMPGVIFFIFNQFASALSLYYLTYNVVTAVQQKWINYQLEQEKEAKEKGGGRPKSSGDGAAANGSGGGFLERLRKKVDEAR